MLGNDWGKETLTNYKFFASGDQVNDLEWSYCETGMFSHGATINNILKIYSLLIFFRWVIDFV